MYPSGDLTDGLFFKVSVEGKAQDKVYVTNAGYEVFTKKYKETASFESLQESLNKVGYKVNEFNPVHLVRY